MALLTLDELKDFLVEEYDCRWEPFSERDPITGQIAHGGIFHREVDGDHLESPYLNDEIDQRVTRHLIRRICKDLRIPSEEVFDWFDRQ